MQALVSSLEKKIGETEKKYEETSKLSEERLKQALQAESKIIQLKTSMQRCARILKFFRIKLKIMMTLAYYTCLLVNM